MLLRTGGDQAWRLGKNCVPWEPQAGAGEEAADLVWGVVGRGEAHVCWGWKAVWNISSAGGSLTLRLKGLFQKHGDSQIGLHSGAHTAASSVRGLPL